MATTRIAKPGQTDQKKVYLNWANHYLRKLGSEGEPLSDLKEIADGISLPRVLKAVVQEEVPGVHATVTTEEERRENIEKCMMYLETVGINSSTFSSKDLCEGKDRAILSLFYSLSQYKRTPTTNQTTQPTKQTRIARPVSPSIKTSHGINTNAPTSPNPPQNSAHKSPVSPNSTHVPSFGSRRTAGSSIMTSTTFDRPYMQRRGPYKAMTQEDEGGGGESKNSNQEPQNQESSKKGDLLASNSLSVSEVKSDNESDNSIPKQKQQKGSKISKAGSFSFGHSSTGSGSTKDLRLHKPGVNKTTPVAEAAESVTPPAHSKLPVGGVSKLQTPSTHKPKESSSLVASEEAPNESSNNEIVQRPPSRLKAPGSGRSTPSSSVRSSIQRPSSRLNKSSSNLTINSSEEGGKSVNQLKIQRKASDGAIKKHQINNLLSNKLAIPTPSNGIQLGTGSLPRHLAKGSITMPKPLSDEANSHHNQLESSGGSEEHRSDTDLDRGTHGGGEEDKARALSRGKVKSESMSKADGFGLRKPSSKGGLIKKSGSFLSGVRTPNLPSSAGPQSTTATEEEERAPNSTDLTSATNNSASKEELVAKQTSGSRLKCPTSPSARHKLHRITPSPAPHMLLNKALPSSAELSSSQPATKVSDVESSSKGVETESSSLKGKEVGPSLQKGDTELSSSHSSLESCEIHSEEEDNKGSKIQQLLNSGSKNESETISMNAKASELVVKEGSRENDNIIGPPTDLGVAKDSHLRFGRRISPEGMSHEEISSPKIENSPSATTQQPPQAPAPSSQLLPQSHTQPHVHNHISKTHKEDTGSQDELESARKGSEVMEGDNREEHHHSRIEITREHGTKVQRARSLSPKFSHRLMPRVVTRVRGLGNDLTRAHSTESTSSEGTPSLSGKPLKSSLRQKRGDSKSRHSSSSSMEGGGAISPGLRPIKVTISPRSSQVVYDPEETGLHPPHNQTYHVPPKILSHESQSERPSSFASLDSSTTSDSLSPSNSTHTLFSRGVGVTRHASMRTTMSEQMEYRKDQQFLNPGMTDILGSTPELIESFENQLTNMKAELSDKDRMLSMYENSMADLSTKMHMLKKSLEEKDNEIRHLTEKQTWLDLESHSLLTAPSIVETLSDEYLSDSAVEQGKEKKKKKPWKFPFKSKKKEGSHVDHLSPNMDTESIISGRSSKSLKRSFGKRKTSDLVSISEYSPEGRYKDLDTKSTYTVDARSEYGGAGGGLLPLWEDDPIKVFEDSDPGARAEVILYIDTNENRPTPANDSGYYGDILGRQGNISKWGLDSVASSVSSDSSNHGDENAEQFVLGTLSVPPEMSWISMDSKVADIFQHHLTSIDPEGCLGLNEESIYCYFVGEERRQVGNALLPQVTPYQALANKLPIKVYMKGSGQQSCDSLSYKTLMGMESLRSYMSILQETQWLVVMGTKGTCKSSLVTGLAQHLSCCLGAEEGEGMEDLLMGVTGGEIINFNLEKDGLAVTLKFFKTDLSKRVQLQLHPPIIVLEDIYDCSYLEQLLVAATGLSRRPYIVAALSSGTTKGIPLHQLLFHHQIRVITCSPQSDPVAGILTRSLRKQIYQLKATSQSLDNVAERLVNWVPYLLSHLNDFINKFHSNVVNLGPRVFMTCYLSQSSSELESWFLNLWNHFIIPYLMGTIMAGIETYTADPMLEWVDVREWVVETYPWSSAVNVSKLRTLNPEDVGWNHAVRPNQNRYIMVKDDKLHDDTRSILQDTQSMLHSNIH